MADIRKFSSRKSLSPQELREFRFYVAQLRRKGLTDRSSRVARPFFISKGKTLAELVNVNRSKLKPYSPPAPRSKLPPIDSSISIRELPIKSTTLAQLVLELEDNYAEFDKLKKPDEMFAFRIKGTDSLKPFDSARKIGIYLGDSDGIEELFSKRAKAKEVFDSIALVRWNKDTPTWKRQRKWPVKKKRRKKK